MSVDETPSLAELRRAFQEMDGNRAAPCPEPERIWGAVHGELPAAGIREVVEHLAACPACALEWRLARELGGPAKEDVAVPAVDVWRPRRPSWLPAAAAAGLLLIAAGGILKWQHHQPSPERAPTATAPDLRLIASTVPRANPVLAWEPDVPGTLYTVNVTTEDGAAVGRGEDLPEPRYRLPAAGLAPLPPHARLRVTLTRSRPDGNFPQTHVITID